MPSRVQTAGSFAAAAVAQRFRGAQATIAVFLAIGIGWGLAVRFFDVPPVLLPGPNAVFDAALKEHDVLLQAAASTVTVIALATMIAIAAGFATAVLIGISPPIRRII